MENGSGIIWYWIGNLSALLGILGTFFSLFTLIQAIRLKNELNKTLERLEYRENYEDLYLEVASFVKLLRIDDLNVPNFRIQLHDFLSKLKADYTFFSVSIKRTIKKIENHTLDETNEDSIFTLITLLRQLESQLKKEGKSAWIKI